MKVSKCLAIGLSIVAGPAAAEVEPIRVALFADIGSTQESSREAIYKILKATPGIEVEQVTTETAISKLSPENYDVFILPGGTGSGQARAMGVDGGRKITDFVKNGKGVIAICAGGYYVNQGGNQYTGAVDLINAVSWDSANWARGEGFVAVETIDSENSETSRTMWYQNGPLFAPAAADGFLTYTPLVKYVTDMAAPDAPKEQMQGREAVVAAPFGKGRVVAFGPHPELSPDLNHWLVNSVKWAAHGDNETTPTVAIVLEGNTPQ